MVNYKNNCGRGFEFKNQKSMGFRIDTDSGLQYMKSMGFRIDTVSGLQYMKSMGFRIDTVPVYSI